MFQKLVAIEPVSLIPSAEEALHQYAGEVVLFRDVPADADEIVRRIGDADAVLLSYTSRMGRDVIARCPDLRYIGMCCSLYSEKSANVDIAFAREKGIRVLGIRDYGDRGVVEYVLHELTGLLHGFGMPMLRDEPVEIFSLRVGVVGLGVSGRMIADALAFLGADISYYSRSRKPDAEAAGMKYKPLDALLRDSEVVFTCLNKNVLLLGGPEFEALGGGQGPLQHLHRPRLRLRRPRSMAGQARHPLLLRHLRRRRPGERGLLRPSQRPQPGRLGRTHQAGLRAAEREGAGKPEKGAGRLRGNASAPLSAPPYPHLPAPRRSGRTRPGRSRGAGG